MSERFSTGTMTTWPPLLPPPPPSSLGMEVMAPMVSTMGVRKPAAAVGSGSTFARGSLKKLYRRGASADDGVQAALEALYDAADDDSATGGPDMNRGIFPVVAVVDREGARVLDDADVGARVQAMMAGRATHPDGPPSGEEAGA